MQCKHIGAREPCCSTVGLAFLLTVSDESLLALHAVFGPPLERALEMLEKDCVTLLTTPNDTRQALQVEIFLLIYNIFLL